jgi:hypothetical protein
MADSHRVQTVAAMWETWRRSLPEDADSASIDAIRAAFYGGFSMAILNLLSVGPDFRTPRNPEASRTAQLEAWDAEITEDGVRRIVAGSPDPA